jgi:hypothetical protein
LRRVVAREAAAVLLVLPQAYLTEPNSISQMINTMDAIVIGAAVLCLIALALLLSEKMDTR